MGRTRNHSTFLGDVDLDQKNIGTCFFLCKMRLLGPRISTRSDPKKMTKVGWQKVAAAALFFPQRFARAERGDVWALVGLLVGYWRHWKSSLCFAMFCLSELGKTWQNPCKTHAKPMQNPCKTHAKPEIQNHVKVIESEKNGPQIIKNRPRDVQDGLSQQFQEHKNAPVPTVHLFGDFLSSTAVNWG